MLLDWMERLWLSPELTCFGEAPAAVGALPHFFPYSGPSQDGPLTGRRSIFCHTYLVPVWCGPS